MSTLILPRSIKGADADDHDRVDEGHAAADYHDQALKDGITRTVKWAKDPGSTGYQDGDKIIAVTAPGAERVVHVREKLSNQSKMEVRVYPIRPARPCPGCGLPLYGIGEVQTKTAPWHLACWEQDQAAQALTIPIDFDAEGLPILEGRAKGSGRPRRRKREEGE